MAAKYGSMKLCWKSSTEANPSVRQCSRFQNSVEKPTTDQILAWRARPPATSAFEEYHPPLKPGSDQIASLSVSV